MKAALRAFFVKLCVLSCFIGGAQAASPVKIYTSVFPPIVTDDPLRPGYAYEIIEELFTLVNIDHEIIQVPWARAQALAQQTPQSLIFPLTRTPTREENYNWSFELFKTQTHFVSLKGPKVTPQDAFDKRIGVQLKSSWDNWLTEHKYPNVHRMPKEGYGIVRMLKAGRLDAWYVERSIASEVLPKMGIFSAQFSEPVQVFDTYLATNKLLPFEKIDVLRDALKTMKETGSYDRIMKKYNLIF